MARCYIKTKKTPSVPCAADEDCRSLPKAKEPVTCITEKDVKNGAISGISGGCSVDAVRLEH